MLYKFTFPSDWRPEIFHDLFKMNIGPQTLFPGLDGFARSIKLKMNWETESYDYLAYVRETAAKEFQVIYYVPSDGRPCGLPLRPGHTPAPDVICLANHAGENVCYTKQQSFIPAAAAMPWLAGIFALGAAVFLLLGR